MILRSSQMFSGPVRFGLVVLPVITLITACTACYFIAVRTVQPNWEAVPKAAVRRVTFDATLTASGVSQSSQQTVVKCQLENLRIKSKGGAFIAGGASTILEIIPNGSTVKKGDLLCKLDASEYEDIAQTRTRMAPG
jgi:HlyD family secretion protein